MKKTKIFFLFLLLMACAFHVFASKNLIQAQTTQPGFALSVDPPVSYIYAKPGEKIKHTLLVKNNGRKTVKISVNVTDFKADGRTGQPVLQPGTVFNKQTNPDLQFGEPFLLQPDHTHSINLQFDTSNLIINKEYPLAVLVNAREIAANEEDNVNSKSTNSQAKVSGTVVSNLIVYIGHNEDDQSELIIEKFELPKIIDSFSGIQFELLAKNSGDNAGVIQGKAIIKNIFQHNINEQVFYPDFVLADSTRLIRGTQSIPEIYDAEGKLDPEKVTELSTLSTNFLYKPPIMVGLYNIEVFLNDKQYEETVIALPFSIIAAIGGAFLLFWIYKKLINNVR